MTLREIGVLLDGLAVRDLHHISESQNPTEAIESVRRGLLHPTGARPEGSEPFRRVFITKGVELLVSPEYHARAAARSSELLETIRDILDID
jgi:hypothetical protein